MHFKRDNYLKQIKLYLLYVIYDDFEHSAET